jgi:hypothetical protein
MHNQNISNEQKKTRNILYSILAFTIFSSFILDFYTLINPNYRYLINISMLGICGIVFYIGYKKQLVNKASLIFTIILVSIITAIALLNR